MDTLLKAPAQGCRAEPSKRHHKTRIMIYIFVVSYLFFLISTSSAWCPGLVSQAFVSRLNLSLSDEGGANGLVRAGELLSNVNENAGDALIRAGQAWSVDWNDVTVALEDASQVFYTMKDDNLLYESIAQELEDASTIEGCISIGPPSSAPNLIAIQDHLEALADADEGATVFREAAEALNGLIAKL